MLLLASELLLSRSRARTKCSRHCAALIAAVSPSILSTPDSATCAEQSERVAAVMRTRNQLSRHIHNSEASKDG